MLRSASIALLMLSAGALASAPTIARADAEAKAGAAAPAQPFCSASLNEGKDGAIRIPANAPALLFTDNSTYGARAAANIGLVTASERIELGAPKQDANKLTIVELPSGLASKTGSLTIDLSADCGAGASVFKPRQIPLVLGPVAEIPKTVGALSVRATAKVTTRSTIVFAPSDGLRAFLPVTFLDLSIDGQVTGRRVDPAAADTAFEVVTSEVCVENGAIHREKRTRKVEMLARIAGIAERPTAATMDLVVDCGAIDWTEEGNGTGTTTNPPVTASPNDPASTAGGCSAAPGNASSRSGFGAIAALAFGAVVVMRRRRRTS